MFLLVSLSKSKFFARVAFGSFVWHFYHTGVVCVALVLQLHLTRVTCVSGNVSLMLHSFRSYLRFMLQISLDLFIDYEKTIRWQRSYTCLKFYM